MILHPFADDCAAYLLDALDAAARTRFEEHRAGGCAVCESELRTLSGAGRLLAGRGPSKPLNPRMRVAVLSEMGAGRDYSVRTAAGSWEPVVGGVALKRLFVDPKDGRETRLVRLQPGRHDLAHALPPGTPFLVVEGGLTSATDALVAGDWRHPAKDEALWRVTATTTLFAPGAAVFPAAARATTVTAHGAPELDLGGAHERELEADGVRGTRSLLLRLEPGTLLEERDHEGAEEAFVLEGDCVARDRELEPGDYLRTPDGGLGPLASRSGCRVVRVEHRPARG